MDVVYVKVLILFGLLVTSFLIGFIPVKCIYHYRRKLETSIVYRRVLSTLNCFAAGVFMATCLLDLLPETIEALEPHIKESKKFEHYPVAQFIMIMGLMLMLTVEQCVIIYQEKRGRIGHESDDTVRTEAIKNERTVLSNKDEFRVSYSSSSGISGVEVDESTGESKSKDFESSVTLSVKNSETNSSSTLRSILLLVALSLHSIFEGIAVGLQKQTTDVLEVFIGLSIHKVVLAFSLGMALTQSKLTFWAQIRSIVTFALASPIGMVIGLLIVEYGQGTTSSLAEGILQGIACGTFLYVTFFEILQHELGKPDIRLIKTFFIFLGFMCMSGLFLIHDHDEH
ncbi:solute carrier family 39 (zinc transporter), member 1/2/3 [Mytilus galloprovincialis]|uniref:Solute carrier family 39 (Zinc transporter), member 1/2/3 n=1 Tax=Mytilus galloprovincialis TaxID=29158 RepID=A0A8B6DNT6_MYTGA|nr:solute carrier family 39 (zinc transporter), member 1/2/3 [Mytilus galloprovincialis]